MADPARRLVILRHGESEANRAGVWQGQFDSPLTEVGVLQAQGAAEVIAMSSPSVIVASDLMRAARTGAIVGEAAEVPVTYDERLREIAVGKWTGMSGELVKSEFAEERERHLRGEDFKRGGDGGVAQRCPGPGPSDARGGARSAGVGARRRARDARHHRAGHCRHAART